MSCCGGIYRPGSQTYANLDGATRFCRRSDLCGNCRPRHDEQSPITCAPEPLIRWRRDRHSLAPSTRVGAKAVTPCPAGVLRTGGSTLIVWPEALLRRPCVDACLARAVASRRWRFQMTTELRCFLGRRDNCSHTLSACRRTCPALTTPAILVPPYQAHVSSGHDCRWRRRQGAVCGLSAAFPDDLGRRLPGQPDPDGCAAERPGEPQSPGRAPRRARC